MVPVPVPPTSGYGQAVRDRHRRIARREIQSCRHRSPPFRMPPAPVKLPPLVCSTPPSIVPETVTVPAFKTSMLAMLKIPAISRVANGLLKVRVPISKLSLLAIVTVYAPGTEIVATALAPLGAPLGIPVSNCSPVATSCRFPEISAYDRWGSNCDQRPAISISRYFEIGRGGITSPKD